MHGNCPPPPFPSLSCKICLRPCGCRKSSKPCELELEAHTHTNIHTTTTTTNTTTVYGVVDTHNASVNNRICHRSQFARVRKGGEGERRKILGQTDQQRTDQPADRPTTDRPGHREVLLPIREKAEVEGGGESHS